MDALEFDNHLNDVNHILHKVHDETQLSTDTEWLNSYLSSIETSLAMLRSLKSRITKIKEAMSNEPETPKLEQEQLFHKFTQLSYKIRSLSGFVQNEFEGFSTTDLKENMNEFSNLVDLFRAEFDDIISDTKVLFEYHINIKENAL